jgi:hypothetical protein
MMRAYLLFIPGLLALPFHALPLSAQVPPPQNTAVKLRLEIELRGVLSVTEKTATLTNKETIWEWVEVPEYRDPTGYHAPTPARRTLESRQVDKVWLLELDDNLKKEANGLHEKEVEVIGKCLLLGVRSQADTGKTPASIGTRTPTNLKGGPPSEVPVVVPEGFATSVQSQLLLDDRVTVISLKAAK